MEINETKKLENIRKLIAPYFNTLKSDNDKSEDYKAQIMAVNYYELGCVISNLLKMCIFSLDNEAHIRSSTNKNPINVSLILEMVLDMFPLDELELLGEINQILMQNLLVLLSNSAFFVIPISMIKPNRLFRS